MKTRRGELYAVCGFVLISFVSRKQSFSISERTRLFSRFYSTSRPAVKLSDQGRKSGGVLILVKRTLEKFTEVIDLTVDNRELLKLDKTVFLSEKHVIMCGPCVYPPYSPYYKQSQGATTSSIIVTEQCILDCAEVN